MIAVCARHARSAQLAPYAAGRQLPAAAARRRGPAPGSLQSQAPRLWGACPARQVGGCHQVQAGLIPGGRARRPACQQLMAAEHSATTALQRWQAEMKLHAYTHLQRIFWHTLACGADVGGLLGGQLAQVEAHALVAEPGREHPLLQVGDGQRLQGQSEDCKWPASCVHSGWRRRSCSAARWLAAAAAGLPEQPRALAAPAHLHCECHGNLTSLPVRTFSPGSLLCPPGASGAPPA
jgi:hypothetical protein